MCKLFSLIFISIFLISACKTINTKNESLIYQKAIENSVYPTAKKQSNLVEINIDNKNLIHKTIEGEDYILVVTWKSKNYYPEAGQKYNTGNYEIWVTTAPELLNRMKNVKLKFQTLRLKQLLGLPPTAQNKIFIEFWVRPQDLFRPCPDKEVNDNKCNCEFTINDSLDLNHINWINQNRIDRYYAIGLYSQYPWTQLGYTYDWNKKNKKHIGLSEFVIGKNKNIYIYKSYSTEEYFK